MKILISKTIRDIAERVKSIGDKDLKRYHPHLKKHLDKDILDKVKLKFLGEYAGVKFYYVDGKFIRKHIYIDFALGGNPGRYTFVPEGEIWLEDTKEKGDQAPTGVHEYKEMKKMMDDGWTYDAAHEYASKIEQEIRLSQNSPSENPIEDIKKYLEK